MSFAMIYSIAGFRTWPMVNTTGEVDVVTVPKSRAREKTGQLFSIALKLVSWVFKRYPLLINCARATTSTAV